MNGTGDGLRSRLSLPISYKHLWAIYWRVADINTPFECMYEEKVLKESIIIIIESLTDTRHWNQRLSPAFCQQQNQSSMTLWQRLRMPWVHTFVHCDLLNAASLTDNPVWKSFQLIFVKSVDSALSDSQFWPGILISLHSRGTKINTDESIIRSQHKLYDVHLRILVFDKWMHDDSNDNIHV